MSCASFRAMLLFLDRSLITNFYVYLCNSCNVVSYKAVTVVFFSEHRRNRVAVDRLIEIQYRPIQLRLIHGKQLSFQITSWIFSQADKSD